MIEFFTSRVLSENIGEHPNGFLICKNAVIGRTGFQKYKGAELLKFYPKEQDRKDLGLSEIDPSADIQVFRDPEEVFHPDAMKSFEGMSFTDNHPLGNQFVTTDNVMVFGKGHVQNVRKGEEPLDSGDWPLLADLVITHEDAKSKIEAGERELSSGYAYKLQRRNGRFVQTDILGNHVALVPKGRAGTARINDSAAEVVPQLSAVQEAYRMSKEKGKVKNLLLALGFKAFATDAKPEDMAEAIEEMQMPSESVRQDEHVQNNRRVVRAADEEPDEHGKRMHAALDRVLSRKSNDAKSKDADLESLKDLMSGHFSESVDCAMDDMSNGVEEKAHITDPSTMGTDEFPEKKDEDDKEEEKDGKKKEAKSEDAEPLVELFSAERPTARAADGFAAGQTDGAAFVLRAFKPHIAKAVSLAGGPKSKAGMHLIRAFDTIATSVNQSARSDGNGKGYEVFSHAATERNDAARLSVARGADAANETEADRAAKLNKMFADRRGKAISAEVN